MTGLRILADDLTGALDTAAAFSGEVPVFIDTPPPIGHPYREAAVSVVATPTRDVAPAALSAHLDPVLDWFCSGELAYKKVDSLLRGNTFAEIAWLAEHGDFHGTIFAPAFPGQGRFTHHNRQWVAAPGSTQQPVALPLREAFADLGLNSSEDAKHLHHARSVWIPEILNDADLDRVATALDTALDTAPGEKHLWCGSAGLAQAIARHGEQAASKINLTPKPPGAGPTILISASFQPVLYAQWEALKAARTRSPNTPAIAEWARPAEIAEAIRQAQQGAAEAWFDLSPRREMGQEESQALLQSTIEHIVSALPKPGQLLIVGGDTLLGVCRATGAEALLASASIRNGWGCATLIGGDWADTPCYSRSGAFGGQDDLIEMMQLLPRTTNSRIL